MADANPVNEPDTTHGEHGEVHLPPPSFAPINVAFALCTTFVGFIDQVRSALGPLIWGIGLVWLIASCAAWFRGARREFNDLPESLEGH